MVKPRDESVRARFASELDRNFSVVASAGSGKTTGIIERILSIARSPNAVKILPRLASSAPFLCLIECHFECPDIVRWKKE